MEKLYHNSKIPVIEYSKSNIYIIENILDISFCDILKNMIDIIPLEKIGIYPGNNVECNINCMNDMIKLDDDLYYEFSTDTRIYNNLLEKIKLKKSIYNNKLNGITKTEIIKYIDKMNNIMEEIKEIMYPINNKILFDFNSGYTLRKIYGETLLHIDGINEIIESNINFINKNIRSNDKMIRNASIIFALNDDYDGGEFCFPYYDIKFILKKGSVVIFPPFWTHEHKVLPVHNNTYRYTISTWSLNKL